MLITNSETRRLLRDNVTDRYLRVVIGGQDVSPENIVAESLRISSSIMDNETLRFGGCISSQLTLRFVDFDGFIQSVGGLTEKKIQVYIDCDYTGDPLYPSDTLYLSDTLYPGQPEFHLERLIYTGYIIIPKRLKNRAIIEITAYDEFYLMGKTKCKVAIEGFFEHSPSVLATLHSFMSRVLELYDGADDGKSFQSDFNADRGFQYVVAPNAASGLDEALFKEQADENLTVLDILEAHSELNSRFAYIDPEGRLKFTTQYRFYLDSTEVKPVAEIIERHSGLTCEDFTTEQIGYISFSYNGGKDRFPFGYSGDKRLWYVSDNIITTWIKEYANIAGIIRNFDNNDGRNFVFRNLCSYRPFSVITFGEWWIEVGDRVQATLQTYNRDGTYSSMTVDSFVFDREIRGVAGMRATLSAKGTQFIGKDELQYNE